MMYRDRSRESSSILPWLLIFGVTGGVVYAASRSKSKATASTPPGGDPPPSDDEDGDLDEYPGEGDVEEVGVLISIQENTTNGPVIHTLNGYGAALGENVVFEFGPFEVSAFIQQLSEGGYQASVGTTYEEGALTVNLHDTACADDGVCTITTPSNSTSDYTILTFKVGVPILNDGEGEYTETALGTGGTGGGSGGGTGGGSGGGTGGTPAPWTGTGPGGILAPGAPSQGISFGVLIESPLYPSRPALGVEERTLTVLNHPLSSEFKLSAANNDRFKFSTSGGSVDAYRWDEFAEKWQKIDLSKPLVDGVRTIHFYDGKLTQGGLTARKEKVIKTVAAGATLSADTINDAGQFLTRTVKVSGVPIIMGAAPVVVADLPQPFQDVSLRFSLSSTGQLKVEGQEKQGASWVDYTSLAPPTLPSTALLGNTPKVLTVDSSPLQSVSFLEDLPSDGKWKFSTSDANIQTLKAKVWVTAAKLETWKDAWDGIIWRSHYQATSVPIPIGKCQGENSSGVCISPAPSTALTGDLADYLKTLGIGELKLSAAWGGNTEEVEIYGSANFAGSTKVFSTKILSLIEGAVDVAVANDALDQLPVNQPSQNIPQFLFEVPGDKANEVPDIRVFAWIRK